MEKDNCIYEVFYNEKMPKYVKDKSQTRINMYVYKWY